MVARNSAVTMRDPSGVIVQMVRSWEPIVHLVDVCSVD